MSGVITSTPPKLAPIHFTALIAKSFVLLMRL